MGQGALAIRLAGAGDAVLLLELNREIQALHAAALPHVFTTTVTDVAPFATMLAKPDAYTFIAELGGEPVGYCHTFVARRAGSPFHHDATALTIDQIAVQERHRGAGIGSALLDRVEALAAEIGADSLALSVWTFNEGARRLYRRRGFATTQERMTRELPRRATAAR